MNRAFLYKWLRRLAITIAVLMGLVLFVVLPIGGSYLITNSRFQNPERRASTPEALGLPVVPVEFAASDGVRLRGWWSPGEETHPVIIFLHGLNRSRRELLDRAAESHRRGYGVLLFDLRKHGESSGDYTTLGIFESRDACAAREYVRRQAGDRPQVFWGVSMGASTGLLAARNCPGVSAIISESSFLSFRETVSHHLTLFFGLPSFPIANLIVFVTGLRMGFDPDDGDVEAAVKTLGAVPILFIAGSEDRRMPVDLARRLMESAQSPMKELLIVPGAGHGDAYSTDPETYRNSVFRFLETVRYNPRSSGGF
jgi:pimeloyl-ACP methyl ester carboxylesterase